MHYAAGPISGAVGINTTGKKKRLVGRCQRMKSVGNFDDSLVLSINKQQAYNDKLCLPDCEERSDYDYHHTEEYLTEEINPPVDIEIDPRFQGAIIL